MEKTFAQECFQNAPNIEEQINSIKEQDEAKINTYNNRMKNDADKIIESLPKLIKNKRINDPTSKFIQVTDNVNHQRKYQKYLIGRLKQLGFKCAYCTNGAPL